MNYRDVAKRLKKLGCQELSRHSRGSHRKWYNPITERATVVPDWGGKDLKLGTLRAVMRQLGIDWKDFEHN